MKNKQSRARQQKNTGMWKRWIIIAVCFILIAIRWIWPSVQVDSITIWLIVIAAVMFVLPDLKGFVPYIKRIKIGDTEVELKEQIEKLDTEVQKARNAASVKEKPGAPAKESDNKIANEIDQVLEESSRDPRAALLLLSSKIEQQLRYRLEESGVSVGKSYPTSRLVEAGVNAGVFPQEFLSAFRDFWAVRNQVAHGNAFDVDDAYILSLVSLGTELLKTLTVNFSVGNVVQPQEMN